MLGGSMAPAYAHDFKMLSIICIMYLNSLCANSEQ